MQNKKDNVNFSLPPNNLPIYRVLTGRDDAKFCLRVSEALSLGYELYGSPSITYNAKTVVVAQALIWKLQQQNTIHKIPFQTLDWTTVLKNEYKGEIGIAYWQTLQFENIRIRLVEYSENYFADHWCQKGHFVHCLDGEFISELESGKQIILTKGMSYIVSDDLSSHRSISKNGVKLLIIDGDFLKSK